MQLDRTEIVIRQRSPLELFDLSLLVFKRHMGSILKTCGLIGIPLLIVDVLAVQWIMSEESYLIAEQLSEPEVAMRWRYITHLVALFVMQFPIISLPATVMLGNRMFFEKVTMGSLIRRLLPIAGRSLLMLGFVRLGLVGLAMEGLVDRGLVFDWTTEPWILIVIPAIGLILRAGYPFAPEILGLELCPLRRAGTNEITYAQRSSGLHQQLLSDHMLRFFASAFFSVALVLMLLGTMLFVQGNFLGSWRWNAWFDFVWLPLTLGLVGSFLAVFRFLSYLDSRIRLEGWEIELRMRAEADRLTPAIHINVGDSIANDSTLEQVAS